MPARRRREAGPRRHLLVFEPAPEGHALEWLQHLVEHHRSLPDTELTIVCAAPLHEALAHDPAATRDSRCVVLALAADEQAACLHRSLVVAAFARWRTMRRYLRRTGADLGFFLSIDLLALPLALGLGVERPISGILFRPSVHYRAIDSGPAGKPTVKERLRELRKDVLYRLMLRSPHLGPLLSLDPYFPAYARGHYAGGDKVRGIPDPALPARAATHDTPDVTDFPPANRVGLLLFGHLTERKGPLVLLDALRLLPPPLRERVAILLAGRIDAALRPAIEERVAHLRALEHAPWIGLEDRRLDEAELALLVQRSAVVLAPYQRFVGSSGVLLWAARGGRPVLAQDYGLVGRLVREHRLGATTDSSRPDSVARTIERMVTEGPHRFIDRDAAARFVTERTPGRFAAAVFATLSVDS
jgi:glycosyltransferase involved in cell wall biosynthesis